MCSSDLKPVCRLLVNTPGALGGVGATTGLPPALTLGCGAVGGSATGDNITPKHLMNIRRVAYGQKELEQLRGSAPRAVYTPSSSGAPLTAKTPAPTSPPSFAPSDVERIAKEVIARLGHNG